MVEIETLQKKERTFRYIAFTLPIVLILVSVLFISLGNGTVNQIVAKRQELLTKEQAAAESQAFTNYLVNNQDKLNKLNLIVPSEGMMISVIQDFESIVTKFDPQGTVQITSAAPIKIGTNLAISLMINCETPLENLPQLLEAIHELPYIHQLLSIDTNQTGELYKHQLSMRMYVQEPFNTP